MGRSVLEALITEVLSQIDDEGARPGPTVAELEKEYSTWERSHKAGWPSPYA